jgi:hypothetical protein
VIFRHPATPEQAGLTLIASLGVNLHRQGSSIESDIAVNVTGPAEKRKGFGY